MIHNLFIFFFFSIFCLNKVLLRMLNAYYNHVVAYDHTLVTKYYGLHCVKLNGPAQKKVQKLESKVFFFFFVEVFSFNAMRW